MGVSWIHEDGGIIIDRMVSRDYFVSMPIVSTTGFSTRLGDAVGVVEGDLGGSSEVSLEMEQVSQPWEDLEKRLASLTPFPSHSTVLQSIGRVNVFGPSSVQKRAKAVFDDIDTIYGQRVGLEIGVYFLSADEAENFGIQTFGFQIGRNVARAGSRIIIGGTGGQLQLGDGTSSVNMETLAQDRSVVDYRLASTIAQSGQVTPINITHEKPISRKLAIIQGILIQAAAVKTVLIRERCVWLVYFCLAAYYYY